ncbi:MAG: tetratricopeptide repeat protein, partial [Nitrospinaceae bacterium]|nr:tetratricopeptide repeat protein [Nitrospinaceae bacterium]NIR53588.1 tetratricopeptide repeat protein [Nitrospinaceae bacterium]NIS83991.1 tetratricopeptide repeat protein [Nitrospinaceae bacterium]NIT80800.1 tetratricopeptide repeat protein [Nitrospinaceae bacterium]NIU43104.1 tetratricopeptide repeat protein [Nitrospinaceae bacterium]
GLGYVYHDLGKFSTAANYLLAAHEALPDPRETTYKLDWSILNGWPRERSRLYFLRALDEDPLRAPSYLGLGWIAYREGQPDLAVEYFLKAISLDPDLALNDRFRALMKKERFGWQVYNRVGWSYYHKGRWEPSREMFQLSIQQKPRQSEARKGLGYVLIRQGDRDAAADYLEECLELNSDPSPVQENAILGKDSVPFRQATSVRTKLAAIYVFQEKYEKALSLYQEELHRHPRRAAAHEGLGRLYMKMNRIPEARAAFTEALRLHPLNPRARRGLTAVKQKRATRLFRETTPLPAPRASASPPSGE